jgi:hypothetical protein
MFFPWEDGVGVGDGELGERACWGSGEGEGEEGLEEVLGRTGGSVEEVGLEVGPIDVCIFNVVNGSAEEIRYETRIRNKD